MDLFNGSGVDERGVVNGVEKKGPIHQGYAAARLDGVRPLGNCTYDGCCDLAVHAIHCRVVVIELGVVHRGRGAMSKCFENQITLSTVVRCEQKQSVRSA